MVLLQPRCCSESAAEGKGARDDGYPPRPCARPTGPGLIAISVGCLWGICKSAAATAEFFAIVYFHRLAHRGYEKRETGVPAGRGGGGPTCEDRRAQEGRSAAAQLPRKSLTLIRISTNVS